jgi:2-polyprenyl-3-methyl-5-hydroxy-6-metoxy-1,4-benzoquinol methylase
MSTEPSREAEQWQSVKEYIGTEKVVLGPYFSWIVRKSPRRLLHLLSYYKFAAKMIGAGKRVLDVGCSEGFGTILLAEAASSCLGVDFDEPAIEVANASVASEKLTFRAMDILTTDPGRFDAVVTLDVIEHIFPENADAFVSRLAGVLDPHGLLIIGTPNITSDQYANEHSRRGHVNLYSAKRLQDLGLRHFHNVFSFSANDEMVHTGFSPLAHYLLALCVDPK